ncbi:uncharacterized protein LOC120653306 [Panicum virgatum]|uniref:uncharacterized protein LOC120653306 n=1 Tax=Panicum virgatum TaxID=38727 RepID=UPI0019D5761B|nr:uncharacterized protein LOC120653306 [Panicum virgatum]
MVESASAGRTRIRRAASPVLPEELVVWEILVRLPAKALLRCRAVCRPWLRLITSDPDFLRAHHLRQPSLPLVFFHNHISFYSRDLVDAAVDAFDLRRSPAERQPVLRFNDCNHHRHFEVRASHTAVDHTARPRGSSIAGLYPHGSSGEYRVLYREMKRKRCHDGGNVYYVLTVGSSAEPRCIGCPVTSPSMERSLTYISHLPAILLRSCLHWGQRFLKHELIAFDTVAESFRRISAPADYNWAWSDLFDMDGMLGVSSVNESETMVELWVLQDYKMENGDMLVYCDNASHLFHCSSNGKLLQKFQWDRVFLMVTGHCYLPLSNQAIQIFTSV